MKSFSQFGEDALVWERFGRKPDGFFVEVGANHPTELSNTWFLEQRGWSGILIEPLTEKCALLREARKASQAFQVAIGGPGPRGAEDSQRRCLRHGQGSQTEEHGRHQDRNCPAGHVG